MEKIEKTGYAFLVIAEVAIIAFWIAGINDKLDLAAIFFTLGGVASGLTLGCWGLQALRKRSRGY